MQYSPPYFNGSSAIFLLFVILRVTFSVTRFLKLVITFNVKFMVVFIHALLVVFSVFYTLENVILKLYRILFCYYSQYFTRSIIPCSVLEHWRIQEFF